MDELLIELLGLVCIAEMILQIVFLTKFKKSKKVKYWDYFFGMTVTGIASGLLSFKILSNNEMGLGGALLAWFIGMGDSGMNVVLFVIGLVVKRTIPGVDTILNKNILLASGVILAVNCSLSALPMTITNVMMRIGEGKAIRYLENKYGEDNEYEIMKTCGNYQYMGFNSSLVGYYYEVKNKGSGEEFLVLVDRQSGKAEQDWSLPDGGTTSRCE